MKSDPETISTIQFGKSEMKYPKANFMYFILFTFDASYKKPFAVFFPSSFSSRKDRSTCCLRQMRKKYTMGYFEEFIGTENTSIVNYSRHLCFRSFFVKAYHLFCVLHSTPLPSVPRLMEIRGTYHSYF